MLRQPHFPAVAPGVELLKIDCESTLKTHLYLSSFMGILFGAILLEQQKHLQDLAKSRLGLGSLVFWMCSHFFKHCFSNIQHQIKTITSLEGSKVEKYPWGPQLWSDTDALTPAVLLPPALQSPSERPHRPIQWKSSDNNLKWCLKACWRLQKAFGG